MPIHVLLIEDNPGDARLIVEMLKESGDEAFSVECAESLSIAFDKLSKQSADVVLLDLSLPDSHGLDTLFRFQSKFPKLPTLILTGMNDEEAAVEAARAGAQDYFLKGSISEASLARALKYAIERKKAEEKYRTLFDSMDEGFCTIEVIFNADNKAVDYRFLEVNPAFEKQTGIRDAPGRTMRQIAPKHEDFWFEIYGEIALTGEPSRFDHNAAQLNRWFDVYAFRIGEPQERKVAILFNDITPRKQSEAARQESETNFKMLADFVPQMVWMCTPDGLNVYFNQRWVDYTGMSLEESCGRGWSTPFHDEDKQAAWDAWNHAVATGESYRVESRLRAADGTYRWFLMRGTPMRDGSGSIIKWFGTCTDIEEMKRVERELRDYQLELLLRQRIAEIFLTSPDEEMFGEVLKVILDVTESKEGLFGYIDEDGAIVYPSMTLVWDRCQVEGKMTRYPRETWTGIWGRSMIEKRAMYSNEPGHVPDGHVPIHRTLTVPILEKNDLLGQFTVANRATDYTDRDKEVLEGIAEYVAPVLTARLQRDRQEVARKEAQGELRRLNEELEDRIRQRTAELEAASKWLGLAQRGAAAGCWTWDICSGKLTWSEEFYDLFGLDPKTEPSFETWRRAVHPEDQKHAVEAIDRAVTERAPLENEYRIFLGSGQERWVRAMGNTVYNAAGQAQTMSGICIDVTERKRAEQAIDSLNQEVKRRAIELQTIFDTAPIGLAIADDSRGEHIRGNPALERMVGVEAGGEISKRAPEVTSYRVLRDGNELSADELPMQRAARGEPVTGEILEAVRPRETNITMHCSAAPLFDENGRARGAVGAFVNISEQKRTERALQQRTTDLATLNKELEAFNYAVAHDLRGPLRHIHSFTEILAEEAGPGLDETSRKHLRTIQNSVQHMAQLLEDLLDMARFGRQELRTKACGLTALVKEVVATLQPEMKERRVEWRIAELPFVDCDPMLMKQALVNLLSNALKFTKNRELAIIEVGQTMVDGEPAIFVRDNGVGFNMKYADKLFGLFQRLHRQEDFEGTGVGLAIVRRIVHRHGGRVWVEAEPGKGATFYLRFPARGAEKKKKSKEAVAV